jgi:hypothetical protein
MVPKHDCSSRYLYTGMNARVHEAITALGRVKP